VKKAKGSGLPGAEIVLAAAGMPMRMAPHRDVATDPSHAKEKGQIEYDLTFLAKVLPAKNGMPAYLE
jgi:hypothetical protein